MATNPWKLKNPDRVKAYDKAYREKNRARMTEYQRQWKKTDAGKKVRQRFREKCLKWLNEERRACEHCGCDDQSMLDFHHLRPEEKSGNVPTLLFAKGLSAAIKERAKCIVLCKTCHKKEHGYSPHPPRVIQCPHCSGSITL